MDKLKTYQHLPESPCLSQEQIFRYLDEKMTAAEMYTAEKHLLDCDLCSDAIEGIQLVNNRSKLLHSIPVVDAQKKEQTQEARVIPLVKRKPFWYASAASILLVIGVFALMKFSVNYDTTSESKQIIAQHIVTDSIATSPNETATLLADSNPLEKNTGELEAAANQQLRLMPSKAMAEKAIDYETMDADRSDFATSRMVEDITLPKLEERSKDQPNLPITPADEVVNAGEKSVLKEEAKEDKVRLFDKVVDAASTKEAADLNKKKTANRAGSYTAKPGAGSASAPTTNTTSQTADDATEETGGNDANTGTTVSTAGAQSGGGPYPNQPTDLDLDLSYQNGLNMMAANKYAAAIAFFDEVLKRPSHHNYADAQWQKAEALIKLNRKEEAKKLLTEIAANPGKYQEQAKEKVKTL
jgi:tetratricopeptide (TPR) repeat protein